MLGHDESQLEQYKIDTGELHNVVFNRHPIPVLTLKRMDATVERSWPQLYEYSYGIINYALKLADGLKLIPRIRLLARSQNIEAEFNDFASTLMEKVGRQVQALRLNDTVLSSNLKAHTKTLYHIVREYSEDLQNFIQEHKLKSKLKFPGNFEIAWEKLRDYQRIKYNYQVGSALEDQCKHLIEQIYSKFIVRPYTVSVLPEVEGKSFRISEVAKDYYSCFRERPLTPVISLSGAPELKYSERLSEALGLERANQLDTGSETLIAQVTEQARKKPTGSGEIDGGILSKKQLAQYLEIYDFGVLDTNNKGQKSVRLSQTRKELFWFYIMPKSEQLGMYYLLAELYRDAEEIVKSLVVSEVEPDQNRVRACFEDLVNFFYSHNGHITRIGPGMHNAPAKRSLVYTKNTSGDYQLAFDTHRYLPDGVATSGVSFRVTAPVLTRLEMGDPLWEQELVQLAMDNIEQDLMSRLQTLLDRRIYELSNQFVECSDELILPATRVLFNLLSPGRYDAAARNYKWLMGGSHDDDNEKMTGIIEQACRGLRDKYRYGHVLVTAHKSNGNEVTFKFKPNFTVHTKGVNNIRKSSVLGVLQIDTDRDTSSYIAILRQLESDFSLYARFSRVPGLARYNSALLQCSKLFAEFTMSPDIALIELDRLNTLEGFVSQLKNELRHSDGNDHGSMFQMALRADAVLMHLRTVNTKYPVSCWHHLEALSNALLLISMNPELVTNNCKSANDRTGAIENLYDLLIFYYVKTDGFPELSESGVDKLWNFTIGMFDQYAHMPKDLQTFFYSYHQVLFGGGDKFRVRGTGCGEVAMKSFPHAHSVGVVHINNELDKVLRNQGYSGLALSDNKLACKMSKYTFKQEFSWYQAYLLHPLMACFRSVLLQKDEEAIEREAEEYRGSRELDSLRQSLTQQDASDWVHIENTLNPVAINSDNADLYRQTSSTFDIEEARYTEEKRLSLSLRWEVEKTLATMLLYYELNPLNSNICDRRSWLFKLTVVTVAAALSGAIHFCWGGHFDSGESFVEDWSHLTERSPGRNSVSVFLLSFICYGLTFGLLDMQTLIKHHEALFRCWDASSFLTRLSSSQIVDQQVIAPFFDKVRGYNPVAIEKARQLADRRHHGMPCCPWSVLRFDSFVKIDAMEMTKTQKYLRALDRQLTGTINFGRTIPILGTFVGIAVVISRLIWAMLLTALWPVKNASFTVPASLCAYGAFRLSALFKLISRQHENLDSVAFSVLESFCAAGSLALLFYHCQRKDSYSHKHQLHVERTAEAPDIYPIYAAENRVAHFRSGNAGPQDVSMPRLEQS